jgi:uncharacterized RDD family membrane protein YckC
MSEVTTPGDGGYGGAQGGAGEFPPPVGGGGEPSAAPATALAGFWVRFAGLFIDGLIFFVVQLILGALFTTTTTEVVGGVTITVRTGSSVPTVIILILELAYFGWFWTTRGASLGQQMVGIRVVDSVTFGPLKPSQAVVRYIGYLISGIPLLLGFLWAAWDPKKQGWMDKLAGTQVVRSR